MKTYLKNEFDFSEYINFCDEVPLWSAPFGLKLLEYVQYKPNISALDIGFGAGFPLIELTMRLGNSCKVYGIDPWDDAIARTRKKIVFYNLSNIIIFKGEAESIPLEDNSVDLIVSNNGINNVGDMDKVFAECSRVCKPGGQFVQTMNLDKSMFEFYSELEKVLKELNMLKEIELMHQHINEKRSPLNEIIPMIQKHGFNIKNLEHDQFNYRFTDATAMLNHYFIRLAFMESWIKLLPPDKTSQIFDTIETRLNEQAKLLGEFKLSIPFVLINAIKI